MRPERLESIIRAAEKAGKIVVRTRVTKDEVVLEYADETQAFSGVALTSPVDLVGWKK